MHPFETAGETGASDLSRNRIPDCLIHLCRATRAVQCKILRLHDWDAVLCGSAGNIDCIRIGEY
jgi:hypothetical protein